MHYHHDLSTVIDWTRSQVEDDDSLDFSTRREQEQEVS